MLGKPFRLKDFKRPEYQPRNFLFLIRKSSLYNSHSFYDEWDTTYLTSLHRIYSMAQLPLPPGGTAARLRTQLLNGAGEMSVLNQNTSPTEEETATSSSSSSSLHQPGQACPALAPYGPGFTTTNPASQLPKNILAVSFKSLASIQPLSKTI